RRLRSDSAASSARPPLVAEFGEIMQAALRGGGVILALALATWLASLLKRDVSIVDSVWSLLILSAGLVYGASLHASGPRASLVLVLLILWSLRLAVYITARNWGEAEDHRYRAIRARN